mgnify:CR=1 FL=1
MNTLTYILQMKDGMSATLSRVGANTESTTQEVRELKGEVSSLNKISLGGFFSKMTRIAGILGVGAALGKSVRIGMEQEMRNTSFEVLFGGVDNAKKMIDDISNYAAKSPYGKAGLSEATQMMAGFGIAQDKIMPNLMAIGDIAIGNKDRFHSLTLAFSQMSSAGKLMGQDLLQMVNAGFNPLEQISKKTGRSIGELRQDMEKGLITSNMVTQAFQDVTKEGGKFNGMIDKINGTVGGQWATAMDNISDKLLNLYFGILQPAILPALQKFNRFLEDPIGTIGRLVDKITTNFPVISSLIIGVTAAIATYNAVITIVTLKTKLWAAAQAILNTIMSLNPVGLIIAGVVALIALITFLVVKISGWGEAWEHTVNGARLTWESFTEHIKNSFNTVVNQLMIGINKIKEGWYNFKEAIGIGDSSENKKMLAQIQADTESRKKAISDGIKRTGDLEKRSREEFKKAAGSFSWNNTSFADIANSLKGKLGISSPVIPGAGATDLGGGVTDLMTGGGGGNGAGRETANSIATGGTKTTHITIILDNLVETVNINKNGFRESAENMRDIVLDEMTRVLAMAQGQI